MLINAILIKGYIFKALMSQAFICLKAEKSKQPDFKRHPLKSEISALNNRRLISETTLVSVKHKRCL